jgi:hypothetical protein
MTGVNFLKSQLKTGEKISRNNKKTFFHYLKIFIYYLINE